MKKRRIELNLEELDRIIDRGTQAPLTEAEGQKIKTALHLMAEKLLPSKRSTEKTSAVLEKSRPASEVSAKAGSGSPAGHGRHGAVDFGGATRVSIPHPSIHAGNSCPDCGAGKVYRQKEPATLLRIVGQAPLQTTLFEMERLRCNACGQIFTAVAPETAGPDKYAPCAVAMIALLKYGTGMPFKRLERLEGQLAMPLPAATQWELMEAGAKQIRPALQELIWQAGQGSVLHNDDTSMRILQLTRETGDKRTGIFTSGIVSIVGTRTIALFFTGTKHAGENIAEVLKQRDRELPVPIQMCDALSRNTPKAAGVTVLLAHCMAHGRRQIVDVAENFPEECRHVLETLGMVYHNDALTRERELSSEQRLLFHQEHSAPLMKELHTWMKAQLEERRTEPNSGLGKAIRYLLNHWTKLTLFLTQPEAPLDNNIVNAASGIDDVMPRAGLCRVGLFLPSIIDCGA